MELVNIPLQAGLWFGLVDLPLTAVNLVGFSVFALLLVQGAGYWAAKLSQLRGRGRGLPGERAFRAALAVNPILLAAALAVTGHATATDPGRDTWPGLAFAAFAVLEHINYFHTQLMHDTFADLRQLRSAGLRRSHLARDLRRARRTSSQRPPGT
ncbi:hypothetical protein GCM10022251_77910 [Phytohabitans flavus]|uniref:Uncharacterized protein n=2 Tax=Phytohabitans flavus TaxID=1076124 RepID=A0A6F8XNM1_9ACTN|nr:hypothetical protein Pflav_018070 [Phytohabitans flavus]